MPQFTTPSGYEQSNDYYFGRYKIPVGYSVLLRDGTYTTVPYPWMGELVGEDGVDYFLGGRTYTVSQDVADALVADGYEVADDEPDF